MQDFEKLGMFYLGRPYDLAARKAGDGVVLYDSKDLVTHGVSLGMTGSGKTGLCIAILEEAAIDGIPALAIDPKGDLTNLMLTFPGLTAEEFAPWISQDEARGGKVSAEDAARQEADGWRRGLADWGQDKERIRKLRDGADVAIYTPGSTAGLPLSILKSFDAPAPDVRNDAELLRERINTTVTSLLTLVGVDADPVRSREHILLSTILSVAWTAGRDLDIAAIIDAIQKPPLSRVGALDTEAFYPAHDRFELAMRLNNLLAAPGFAAWTQGDPLDIGHLLHTPAGKPRIAILSIAHLDDSERMFFVSLLLNQILGWMRAQTGTSSLRTILYMDEIAGYFPPVANPPSKPPLLTLLKQGRAFGLGVLLATQNPVDLDYKGLSNIGTWFLGRLQTERDKARVLDGLEGAAAGGERFDRTAMDQTLAGLQKRVFLMRNVHEDQPIVFETRWTLSYLRGPLTREQIKTLMAPRKDSFPAAQAPPDMVAQGADRRTAPTVQPVQAAAPSTPLLTPDIRQYFLPLAQPMPATIATTYEPRIFAAATVRFIDRKLGVDVARELALVATVSEGPAPVRWDQAQPSSVRLADLLPTAPVPGGYAALPPMAAERKSYDGWTKEFIRWVWQTQTLELFRSRRLGLVSRPGETERDFRIRLQISAREQRDKAVEQLRQKYAARVAAQSERVRVAEQAQARENEQATQQKLQTTLSFGATLVGALLGRKALSASTLGRATTAARGVGRSMKESQDVQRAGQSVQAARGRLAAVEAELAAETAAIDAGGGPTEELDVLTVAAKRTDVAVQALALVWEGRPGA